MTNAIQQAVTASAPENLDLAALGREWKPPQMLDATPEVADVLAAMPWWAARGLIYVILGAALAALLWAYFGQVDVVVAARGALQPEGYTRPVQAVEGGRVQYVLAREGETVTRGQLLVQLDATEARTRVRKLREELQTSQEQLRQWRALKGPTAETLEQENRIARLQSELAAAEQSLQHTTLTAPVGGVLTTLAVRGVGAVLQAGQQVGTIAPAGARLVAEAQVANRDITFIRRGLPAKLKFDAFPFQDYGVVPGTIIEVAPDAAAATGAHYKVLIAFEQTSVVAQGQPIPLRAGLTLTAELVTERKTILALLFEPFRKLKGELQSAQ